MERRGFLPPLAPQTPEQRVDARLRRISSTPRMPTSARGGGVLLRSELVEQNDVQAQEIEDLRARLADSDRQRKECEQQLRECQRKLEEALKKAGPSAEVTEAETAKDPEGYKPGALRDAAMAGELSAVNELLDKGVDPNSPRECLADWTPLHYAAQLGHTEIINTLLDHGAEPQPRDKGGQTPLMQTGYWGHTEAKELLLRRGGGEESEVPPKMIMEADTSKIGRWDAEGTVTIICSAPEFSLPYEDGTKDNVMKALFGLCSTHASVKFGYDWGGSSTAEPADTDPNRLVPECCLSLACSCGEYRSTVMVKGPVQWWNPKSVAGSVWFPKYRTKVMGAIHAVANAGVKLIVMVALKGGPVTQLEHRTMPLIVHDAVKDLQKKGMSISLLGDAEETDIKLCLRIMEYDELLSQFYDNPTIPLSKSSMCIAAAAKKTQWGLRSTMPANLTRPQFQDEDLTVRTKFAEEDAAAILKPYEALSEEDKAKADEARGKPAEENVEALTEAATYGRTAEVRVLLAAGTDPDATNGYGKTALHCAALDGHEEALGALVEGGADPDKANAGVTALMRAASFGGSGVVRRLLELGADHTVVGTGGGWKGKTALQLAEAYSKQYGSTAHGVLTEHERKKGAAAVLRRWAERQTKIAKAYAALSKPDRAKADAARGRPAAENEEALRDSADRGKTAEVRVLLAAGTDPDAAGEYGRTALLNAAHQCHGEVVVALAEAGADLDRGNNVGATPLMAAAHTGTWLGGTVVRRLLELGADHTAVVRTDGPFVGKTALDLAGVVGKEETAAVLREWAERQPKIAEAYAALSKPDRAKADEAKGRPAEENEQALREAAESGQTAEVRVLLAAGTYPDAADGNGNTALGLAAWKGHWEAGAVLQEWAASHP